MMMINPEVYKGNFGAPPPKPYDGDDNVVTSKLDTASDFERGWTGWEGENTTGEIEQTPKLAAISVIEQLVSSVPELAVTFGSNNDDGLDGVTFNLKTEEAALLKDNDMLVAQYQAEFAVFIKFLMEKLKESKLSVRIEEVGVFVSPGMFRSAGQGQSMRQSMFTIEGQYKLYL